ncbi:hypothetical protein MRX96_046848 [Rhipicephalus microplus]
MRVCRVLLSRQGTRYRRTVIRLMSARNAAACRTWGSSCHFTCCPCSSLEQSIEGAFTACFVRCCCRAFNSLPKPGAALVHMITVPLMGLMKPEQIAHQYLSVEALALAMMLCLVVVVDHWSDLSLHLVLNVSQCFGLRRGRLFTLLCLCCFVCASLFSGVVTSAALLYMLHRVLYAIFKEDMDRAQGVVVPPKGGFRGSFVQGSLQETSSMRSVAATGDQVLFERLTQVVLSMQKPDGTSHTPTSAPQLPNEQSLAVVEPGTLTRPLRGVDALSMEPGTQASTNGVPMPLQTLVRVDVTDEGAFLPGGWMMCRPTLGIEDSAAHQVAAPEDYM